MQYLLFILLNNVVPIFLLILLGYTVGRKFGLNMYALSKLNIFVFVPIFVFVNLYSAEIPSGMSRVLAFVIALMAVNFALATLAGRVLQYDMPLRNALRNSTMFYNSGNIGIPLITLVFQESSYLELALTVQILVLVVQNVSTYTVGFFNAGRANMRWQTSVRGILRMPTIYAIPAAFILRDMPFDLMATPVWPALSYVRDGLIAVALLTLGIQLSRTKFDLTDGAVYLSAALRLLGAPAAALLLIHLFGFDDVIAKTLFISSAVPTAVNTVLVAIEYRNRPDFASQAVMTSTLASTITLSVVIFVSEILFPLV